MISRKTNKCRLFLLGSVVLFSLTGCKASQWQRSNKETDRQAAGTLTEPRRVQSADAVGGVATSFELDPKTGRPKQGLVLRLDYFPKSEQSSTNLPACYGAFSSGFELGVFMCEGSRAQTQTLTAGNVAQDCYTNPRFERVLPSAALTLPGCARGLFVLHGFEPAFRIDIEQRETM